MTKEEYQTKRDMIFVSDAPVSVKEEALAKLENQYVGSKARALRLIEDCAADPIQQGD